MFEFNFFFICIPYGTYTFLQLCRFFNFCYCFLDLYGFLKSLTLKGALVCLFWHEIKKLKIIFLGHRVSNLKTFHTEKVSGCSCYESAVCNATIFFHTVSNFAGMYFVFTRSFTRVLPFAACVARSSRR